MALGHHRKGHSPAGGRQDGWTGRLIQCQHRVHPALEQGQRGDAQVQVGGGGAGRARVLPPGGGELARGPDVHTGVVVVGVKDAPLFQYVEGEGLVHDAVQWAEVHIKGGSVGQRCDPYWRAVVLWRGVVVSRSPGDVIVPGEMLGGDAREAPVVTDVRGVGADDDAKDPVGGGEARRRVGGHVSSSHRRIGHRRADVGCGTDNKRGLRFTVISVDHNWKVIGVGKVDLSLVARVAAGHGHYIICPP